MNSNLNTTRAHMETEVVRPVPIRERLDKLERLLGYLDENVERIDVVTGPVRYIDSPSPDRSAPPTEAGMCPMVETLDLLNHRLDSAIFKLGAIASQIQI